MVFEDLSFDEKTEIWWKIADTNFNSLSKFIWDEKIMTGFTGPISSTRIGHLVLMMDIKVSKDNYISRRVDWEYLLHVNWNSIKTVNKKGDR